MCFTSLHSNPPPPHFKKTYSLFLPNDVLNDEIRIPCDMEELGGEGVSFVICFLSQYLIRNFSAENLNAFLGESQL